MNYRLLFLLCMVGMVFFSCEDDGGETASLTGRSGSLARFATTPTHLYAVDDESLNVYQILNNGSLEKMNTEFLGEGVETIFAKGNFLYIGTNSAMFTYDITHPADPAFVSSYSHFVACDPVVVQDTLAYVTIRSNNCNNANTNTLDIVNIKNPQHPTLVSNYNLESPYGLGIDGKLLFICEGDFGLKILDVTNPHSAKFVKKYTQFHAWDVIPNDGVLIVTGKDGVSQYDYSDPLNITRLSIIPVTKPL